MQARGNTAFGLLLVAAALGPGCAQGVMPAGAAVSVVVTPRQATVGSGGTVAFKAAVTGGATSDVTWSVQEYGGGTMNASGMYTAPANAGTFHVVATSVAETSSSDAATVTVMSTPVVAVSVSPHIASVTTSGTVPFTATVSGTSAGQSTAVTWSVQEAGGGTVSSAGVYTAPGTTGTNHVVATSVADTSKKDTATVTVTSTPVIAVSISPQTASVMTGGTVPFTATVTGTTAGQPTAVTWSVQETGGGTVSAAGVYTAPGTGGTYHVVATSVADTSKTDAALVTVTSTDSTLIPADRLTLWNPGLNNAVGGIPTNRTQCGATISPRGGILDDSAAIQAALDACPANRFVLLGPGTFNVHDVTPSSNTTLRGSGPGTTILNVPTNGSAVIVGTLFSHYADQRTFTADATKDTFSVTVDNVTGLRLGEVVSVTEQYDPNLTKYDNPSQLTGGDYLGWGECRCYHSDGGCRLDSGTGCNVIPVWTAQAAINQSRPVGQVMEISTIVGSTLTFTTPFHTTYRTSHAARLSRYANNGGNVISSQKTRVGIEELSVINGGGTDECGPICFLAGTSYSWAKHIEISHGNAVNFLFKGAFRCVLRDSYLHETTDPNPGGAGYGIGIDSYSADNLVENNISWAFNKVMVMRSAGGGNVIAYNYMQDGYGAGYATLPEVGINASHMATSHHELFEGNESHNMSSDTTWGNTIYITALRNHLTGLRIAHAGLLASLTDQGNRRAIDINDGDKWFSFVGNVLGSSGMCLNCSMPGGMTGQTSFKYEATTDSDQDAKMWQLFYADAPAQSTLLRMGNFDWATQTQKWPGFGGIGTPDNPPSPLPTLPDSLYLSSKPAFFGSNPWPWVVPATGTTYTLPAKARFDAGTPNSIP